MQQLRNGLAQVAICESEEKVKAARCVGNLDYMVLQVSLGQTTQVLSVGAAVRAHHVMMPQWQLMFRRSDAYETIDMVAPISVLADIRSETLLVAL